MYFSFSLSVNLDPPLPISQCNRPRLSQCNSTLALFQCITPPVSQLILIPSLLSQCNSPQLSQCNCTLFQCNFTLFQCISTPVSQLILIPLLSQCYSLQRSQCNFPQLSQCNSTLFQCNSTLFQCISPPVSQLILIPSYLSVTPLSLLSVASPSFRVTSPSFSVSLLQSLS